MNIIWYKKFFSINIQYQVSGGTSFAGVMLDPCHSTKTCFEKHKIRYKLNPGKIDVFIQGVQEGSGSAFTPLSELEPEEFLYFRLQFDDESLLKRLKLFPDAASLGIGFPLLFSGVKPSNAATPVLLQYEKIQTLPASGSVNVKAIDAALNTITYTSFRIIDLAGRVRYTNNATKTDDGTFKCSYEMEFQKPGIYTLELGAFTKKFFLDTRDEFKDSSGVIQITRNAMMKYPATINSNSFTTFNYTILKV